MDYPRSDRHLLAGVQRLTRINTRLTEQVVDLDGEDDVYNWPIMYAVEVGHWQLPDDEAKQLGEYLQRGGFLMVDDFHGDKEWAIFVDSMSRALPGREIVDIPNSDPIFHTIYDLGERFQVPGAQFFESGKEYEAGMDTLVTGEPDYRAGKTPHWRGIYDDKGRVIVAICHNMDLGDAWEVSDEPRYPGEMGFAGVSDCDELFCLRSDALVFLEGRRFVDVIDDNVRIVNQPLWSIPASTPTGSLTR